MYLRFISSYTNEWDEPSTGVFQALGHLIRDEDVFEYDRVRLKEIRTWFNVHLERPTKFNKTSNKNKSYVAISWFKDTAIEHLERMYDLIPIYENYDLRIETIKRGNPGYVVFEDEFQISTIPFGKEKSEVL